MRQRLGRVASGGRSSLVSFVGAIALIALVATAGLGDAHGGRGRSPPTAPTDLRVTGIASWSVSLAWGASADDSGSLSYVVHASNGAILTVPQTVTEVAFTSRLEAGFSYSFYITAVDGAGRSSKPSNTVSATLPRDTQAPSAPAVSVVEVGPTHVTLEWSSTDDGPYIFYQVFVDGAPVLWAGRNTSGTVTPLEPGTSYTITVQARDNGINWSPPSAPLTVTTQPPDPSDTTAPTAVTGLTTNGMVFDNEIWLFWDASTDDHDPQAYIRYDVYDNGILVSSMAGFTRTIFYGTAGVLNEISVFAVDTAGNTSLSATLTIDLT
jgi:chitodextrinase